MLSSLKFKFQSTLPRRERRDDHLLRFCARDFNPRSREGSDVRAPCGTGGGRKNFNPRSREGSDIIHHPMSTLYLISIHAPAKGATFFHTKFYFFLLIFQSTLPRRERRFYVWVFLCINNFNPRSREGSDQADAESVEGRRRFQSTLPRRERRSRGAEHSVHGDFNPRSREGSDELQFQY